MSSVFALRQVFFSCASSIPRRVHTSSFENACGWRQSSTTCNIAGKSTPSASCSCPRVEQACQSNCFCRAITFAPSLHSTTLSLKKVVAALLAFTRELATTKAAPFGRGTSEVRSGLNWMYFAVPGCARKEMAWSIPPPCVPMYRSHTAHMVAISCLDRDAA